MLEPELHPSSLVSCAPSADQASVEELVGLWLNAEIQSLGMLYSVTKPALPWKQMFEFDYKRGWVA